MPSYEADDNEIRAYLVKQYGDEKISKIVKCVITHVSIIQQARGFKSKKDMFEVIDDCAFQYINISTNG